MTAATPTDAQLKRAVTRHKIIEHVKGMEPYNWVRLCFFSCIVLTIVAVWVNVVAPMSGNVATAVVVTLVIPGVLSGVAFMVMLMSRSME